MPQTKSEIDAVFKKNDKPQIIYKHSPRCGTSVLTKTNLESGIGSILEKADVYMIDVISKREISRHVAEKTGVRHESPQIILLHRGVPFWHGSHGDVRYEKIRDVLIELTGTE